MQLSNTLATINSKYRVASKIVFAQFIFLLVVLTWREENWSSHVDFANRVFAIRQITHGDLAPHYLIFNWSHLADHVDFTIYPTAILYLFDHTLPWIMYVQALLLCIAEYFLIRAAEVYFESHFPQKNSQWCGAFIAILFVTNPLILLAVTDDPHLHMFGMVAGLSIVTNGMLRRRLPLVAAGSLLALASGDLATAYGCAVIISFLLFRRTRWSAGIKVLCVMVISSLLAQWYISPVGSNFGIHYGHLGGKTAGSAFDVAKSVLHSPFRAIDYWLRSFPSFSGLIATFGAVGMAVPLGLVVVILNLGSTGLAWRTSVGRPAQPEWPGSFLASPWQMLPTLAIGIAGSVVICIWLYRRHSVKWRWTSGVLAAGILLNSLIFGLSSFHSVISRNTYPPAMTQSLDRAAKLIPKGSTVHATVGASGHISWDHRVVLTLSESTILRYESEGDFFLITPSQNSGRPYSTELPLVEALLRAHAELLYSKDNVWLFKSTSPRPMTVDFHSQQFSGIAVPGNPGSSTPVSSNSMCRHSQILTESTYFVSRLLVATHAGEYMWNVSFGSSKTAVMEVRDLTTGETIAMKKLRTASLESQSIYVNLPGRKPVQERSSIGWGPFWYERIPPHRTYRLELRIWIPYGTSATICHSNFMSMRT
ncbi:MAG: DUF2079 domain-containing protein [Actinobacteria bacterium]|nr:DUF2079 domain-containing protein [Actinomycetota bacterium]